MKVNTHRLNNGIRIVHQQFNGSPISHCAFFINAGSRDEDQGKEGLAHFIEHLLFKGTNKRKAIHIIKRMEVVGAELNAYTTKEETCVHATFLTEHFERAAELTADIVFNSTYPEKEIKNEKEVVIDEIRSYRDNHFEQIHDDFESQVFEGHPLGNLILGSEDSVNTFKQKDLFSFVKKNYYTDEMVFSVGGSLPLQDVIKISEKYFGSIRSKTNKSKRQSFRKRKVRDIVVSKHSSQAHLITGSVAYAYNNKKRFPLYLLNNIIAGAGMNSRLNLSLREKNGLAYHIESNYSTFSDTGLFSVYLATAPEHYDKARTLMNKEFSDLKRKKLGDIQLKQFKQQLIGHMAIARDLKVNLTIGAGKQILNRGKLATMEDIRKNIESVTASDILDVANEILDPKRMSSLTFKPI